MDIVLNVFLLILGFILLVKSAKVFVNGSVEIARRLKISPLVIGLTVVALGTSTPEAVISVMAAFGGSSDIAIANVIGSNLFNMIFIVGFCAALFSINVNTKEISRDYWVSVAATVLLLFMVFLFNDYIPRFGGFVLLLLFVTYMIIVVRYAIKNKKLETDNGQEVLTPKPLKRSIAFVIAGLAVLILSGHLTVSSAVNIATAIGLTERIIGLTVVALGTSLPELVTAMAACRRGEGEIALGLIIGSCIYNIMLVLGLAGSITPLAVGSGVFIDIAALAIGILVFYLFAKSGGKIVRFEGVLMLVMFCAYMSWVLLI